MSTKMVVLRLPVNIIFVRGYAEAGKGNLYPTQAPGFVPIQKNYLHRRFFFVRTVS
jgi:hypothetical protein